MQAFVILCSLLYLYSTYVKYSLRFSLHFLLTYISALRAGVLKRHATLTLVSIDWIRQINQKRKLMKRLFISQSFVKTCGLLTKWMSPWLTNFYCRALNEPEWMNVSRWASLWLRIWLSPCSFQKLVI